MLLTANPRLNDLAKWRTRAANCLVLLALMVALGSCSGDLEGWLNVESDAESDDDSSDDVGDAAGDDPVPIEQVDEAIVASGEMVVVQRVVDGDSLEVTLDGEPIELRLEGFNAPELYADAPDGGADQLTCNGTAAKQAVEAMLETADGQVVLIENGDDRFGRTLGDLVIGGVSLTSSLVAQGEGLATGDSTSRRQQMKSAADQGFGVWSGRCAQGNVADLQIGSFQIDPPGNDKFNLVDEWVEVTNADGDAVSIDGWVLRDDTTGHRFTLSGQLEPGHTLTVYSGGDPADSSQGSGDHSLYLGESFPVWSNSGETIILTDPDGSFVDWRFTEPG